MEVIQTMLIRIVALQYKSVQLVTRKRLHLTAPTACVPHVLITLSRAQGFLGRDAVGGAKRLWWDGTPWHQKQKILCHREMPSHAWVSLVIIYLARCQFSWLTFESAHTANTVIRAKVLMNVNSSTFGIPTLLYKVT